MVLGRSRQWHWEVHQIYILILIGLAPSSLLAQSDEFPDELKEAVAAASAYVGDGWVSSFDSTPKDGQASPEEFSAALDTLVPLITEETLLQATEAAPSDLTARLVLVARDRQQRPDVYEKIHKFYTKPPRRPRQLRNIASHTPRLSRKLFGEEYRMALEFHLMSPELPGMWGGYRWSIFTGLARAGRKESYGTLLYFYGLMCDSSLNLGRMNGLQGVFLRKLASFQSEDALRATLDCLLMSQAQQQQFKDEMAKGKALQAKPARERSDEEQKLVNSYLHKKFNYGKDGDLVNVVRVTLRGNRAPSYAARVALIIAEYRGQGIPAAHGELLDRILGPE